MRLKAFHSCGKSKGGRRTHDMTQQHHNSNTAAGAPSCITTDGAGLAAVMQPKPGLMTSCKCTITSKLQCSPAHICLAFIIGPHCFTIGHTPTACAGGCQRGAPAPAPAGECG